DREFDYLGISPEEAWEDLEDAYTRYLNALEQTDSDETLDKERTQNNFIITYLQLREQFAEREVQADSHDVACRTISANMGKVGKNVISWTKTAINDSQNPFVISVDETVIVKEERGLKRKREDKSYNDQKNNEYTTAIKANISPCPDLPRAKNYLTEGEINRLMDTLKEVIKEEKEKINKSVESFLEALLLSDIISIHHLAKECGARGVSGLCNLLQKSAEEMQDNDKKNIQDCLLNVDVEDDATIYVGKCIEETNVWISRFSGKCQSERSVDMFIVGPYAKTPCTIFLYGENRSDADREDKTERSGTSRVGKACDFLYRSLSRESGIGENSGPEHKDNHDKSITNFIEVIKVAKSQHKKLGNSIIEQCDLPPFSNKRGFIRNLGLGF
ncbi:5964_t:CDS:10, partial [Ambispora gerdemannii]